MSSRHKYSYSPRAGGYATAIAAKGGSDLPIESILAESPASAAVKDEIVKMVFTIAKADAPDAARAADVDASSRARFINQYVNRKSLESRPGPVCGAIAKALNEKLKMNINLNDTPEGICRSVLSRLAELGVGIEQEHSSANSAYARYVQDLEESIVALNAILPRLSVLAATNQASASAVLEKITLIVAVIREQVAMLRGAAGKSFPDRAKFISKTIDQADFATALSIAVGDRSDSSRKNIYLLKILDIIKPLALVSAISKKSLSDLGIDVERVRNLKKNGKTIQQITDELLAEKSVLGQITRAEDIDRLNNTLNTIASIYNGAAVESFSGGDLYPELKARGGDIDVPGRLNQTVAEEVRRLDIKKNFVQHDYIKESFFSSYADSLSALNLALADIVADTTSATHVDRKDQRYIRFRQALTSLAMRNERYVGKLFAGLYSDAASLDVKTKYIIDLDELIASLPLFGELIGKPPSVTRAVAQLNELRALLVKWREYAEKSKLQQQLVYGGFEVVPSVPRQVGNTLISVKGLSQFQTLLEAAIDKTAITANFVKSARNESEVGQRQQSLASTFVAGYVTRIDQLVDVFERLAANEIAALLRSAEEYYKQHKSANPQSTQTELDDIRRDSLAQVETVKLVVSELRDILVQQTSAVKEMFQLLASVNTYVMDSISELSKALAASTFRSDELSQLVDQLRAPIYPSAQTALEANLTALRNHIESNQLVVGSTSAFVSQVFNKTRDLAFDVFKRMTPMYNFLLLVEKIGPSSISKIKAGVVLDTMGKYLSVSFLRISKHSQDVVVDRSKTSQADAQDGSMSLKGVDRFFECDPGVYRDDVDSFKRLAAQLHLQPFDAAMSYIASTFYQKATAKNSGKMFRDIPAGLVESVQAIDKQPSGLLSVILAVGSIGAGIQLKVDGRHRDVLTRKLRELDVQLDQITYKGAQHLVELLDRGESAIKTAKKDDIISPDDAIQAPTSESYQVRIFDEEDRAGNRYAEPSAITGPYRLIEADRGVTSFVPVPALTGVKFATIVRKLAGKSNWVAQFAIGLISLHGQKIDYNTFVQMYALLFSARGGGFTLDNQGLTFTAKSNFILKARGFMVNQSFILSSTIDSNTDDQPVEQLSSKALEGSALATLF